MARRRVIVGVGEALLAEEDEREAPAGLGLLVPIYSVLLGHEGVAVSRLGQDAAASVLLRRLGELGCAVSTLQSDPDLPTGRARIDGRGVRRLLEAQAAFDNLQWDFDLADVAQRADAVVYGGLARRSGQSRSTTDRFLAECRNALRVYDLTARSDPGLDRSEAVSGLGHAQVAVIDDLAIRQVVPAASARPSREAGAELRRARDLAQVVLAQEGRPIEVLSGGQWHAGSVPHERRSHAAAIVGFVHAALAGWDAGAAIAMTERCAAQARERPEQPLRS
jgi:sugar/nucleoside kinase (ribokinase family)